MQTHQYDALLRDEAPAVPTLRPRHQLVIAAGAAVLAITLAACGPSNTRRGTDLHATPATETARQSQATSPPDTVRLPDLTDPKTRKQLACSFDDGYFTQPRAPRDNAPSDCR